MTLYTVDEAAAYFRCSPRHVWDLIKLDELRAKKIGKRWLIREDWLYKYLDSEDKIDD